MANRWVVRMLLTEWFGCSLVVLMVACVAIGVHDVLAPTEFERALAYGSLTVAGRWLLIKGWSMSRASGAKRR